MKRLAAAFALTILGAGSFLKAGDGALPLPTGMAPTSPSVPAPVIVDGLPASTGGDWARTSFRDRLGVTTAAPYVVESKPAGPRFWSRVSNWRPFKSSPSGFGEPYDPVMGKKPTWCENCAPAARQPLPPLPDGISTNRVMPASAMVPTGARPGCADGSCGQADKRSCCQKIKDWICYRQTPIHFPLIPTPRQPSLVSYFPTPAYAVGHYGPGINGTGNCATGNCATGNCGTNARFSRGVGGASCAACPTPGEAILPGYRLANPTPDAVPPMK